MATGKRTFYGIADQAANSIGNFVLAVLIARQVTGEEFGIFGLVYAAYVLALGISRSLASEALAVRYSGAPSNELVAAARRSSGATTALGLMLALGSLPVIWHMSGIARHYTSTLALCLPALLLQDSYRNFFHIDGRPGKAFVNDSIWLVSFVVSALFLSGLGLRSGHWLFFSWGVTGSLCSIVGWAQSRYVPKIGATRNWLRSQRDLVPYFGIEYAGSRGLSQLVLYSVAILAGFVAAGALKAVLVLFGPLKALLSAFRVIGVPEARRLFLLDPAKGHRYGLVVALALGVLPIGWGMALMLVPQELGVWILGESWELAEPLIPLMALFSAGVGASMGAFVGLRVLAAAKRSMRAKLLVGLGYFVMGSIGAWYGGAWGAMLGKTIASLIGCVWWWMEYQTARANLTELSLQRHGAEATDGRIPRTL